MRTARGRQEVDLIVEADSGRVLAIEVKLTQAVDDADVRHLLWLKDKLGDRLLDSAVVTTGPAAYRRADQVAVVPLGAAWPLETAAMRATSDAPLWTSPTWRSVRSHHHATPRGSRPAASVRRMAQPPMTSDLFPTLVWMSSALTPTLTGVTSTEVISPLLDAPSEPSVTRPTQA